MRRAVLSINFNSSRLLQKQTETIPRFIKGEFDFIVGDNSNDPWWRKSNKQICADAKIRYIPLSIREGDPSRHHGLALNECLAKLKDYDQVLILDHDCFPFRRTNVFGRYIDYDYAGIHQVKEGGIVYIAPIFMLINDFKHKDVDLMPAMHLDTGGAMHEKLKTSKVAYVNDSLIEDKDCYYALVDNDFMHFVKGSGWDHNPNHKERLDCLVQKLDFLIEENAKK